MKAEQGKILWLRYQTILSRLLLLQLLLGLVACDAQSDSFDVITNARRPAFSILHIDPNIDVSLRMFTADRTEGVRLEIPGNHRPRTVLVPYSFAVSQPAKMPSTRFPEHFNLGAIQDELESSDSPILFQVAEEDSFVGAYTSIFLASDAKIRLLRIDTGEFLEKNGATPRFHLDAPSLITFISGMVITELNLGTNYEIATGFTSLNLKLERLTGEFDLASQIYRDATRGKLKGAASKARVRWGLALRPVDRDGEMKYVVAGIVPGFPAYEAGLRVGDEVVSIDEELLRSSLGEISLSGFRIPEIEPALDRESPVSVSYKRFDFIKKCEMVTNLPKLVVASPVRVGMDLEFLVIWY